jgi:predicted component of type VI protein secretion system
MEVRVHVERDGAVVAVVELAQERALFGRAPTCDFQLDDPTVSSDHLEITRHGLTALVATDLGSRNGTLLNGQRLLRPTRLKDGDTLTLGTSRLRLSITTEPLVPSTQLTANTEVTLTAEELAVAAALVRHYRVPGALAARPATRAEIAEATHLAERTVTRRLESLAGKLRLGAHEGRERPQLLAQRVLELGLDRQHQDS